MSTYGCHNDEHWLVDKIGLCEEAETEIDEDEIFAELCQTGKHVFAGPLRAFRHIVVCVVFECDAAKEQRNDTAHRETVTEEVARVCDEDYQARFDLRKFVKPRMFQHQGASESENNSQRHRCHENQQKYADAVKERQKMDLLAMELR